MSEESEEYYREMNSQRRARERVNSYVDDGIAEGLKWGIILSVVSGIAFLVFGA